MNRPAREADASSGSRRNLRSSAHDGETSALVHRAVHGVVQSYPTRSPCRVLDVGCGSGVWAVPLAAQGAWLTVVDPSPDALASLARRAREAGVADRITAVQGDVDCLGELVPAGEADLVLGHGVLEVVDDLPRAMSALVSALAPGGVLSILAAGRAAAVLHRALIGRVGEALHVLTDPDGRVGPHDPLLRRFDVGGLSTLLSGAGLELELLQGDAVVADLIASGTLEGAPGGAAALAELEQVASSTAALREIASRLHAMARLPLSG